MPSDEVDVGPLSDWADRPMQDVELAGEPVLLVRDGDAVRAIGGRCPHAGAPLSQGVLHRGRLVCPWHKAAFCVRTGEVLDPPAVDPLKRYEARVENGHVVLRAASAPAGAQSGDIDERTFVIVGGGAAGAVAAQTLREIGYAGRLVLLDRENRVPYDRTVLSKYLLSGEQGGEKSPLQSQAYYRQGRIERRTAEVTAVDPAARRITCADGSVLDYAQALLAPGSVPTAPTVPGSRLDNVFLLRSRADADAILAQAERSERVVVLGASFIGMEVAASLRERGLEVTVAGKEEVPFAALLGTRIGTALMDLHRKRGVTFRLGRGIAELEGDGAVRAVVLDDGERLPADLVVVGFGVRPAAIAVRGVSADDDGGFTVDATLRADDGLYVAGDLARFPVYGSGPPIRVEHWRVAEQHGRVAARNMAGLPTRYEAPPVFWTIQYRKRLDYIGHAEVWDDIVVHGDLGKPEFLAYLVRDGIVAAAVGMDRDRDTAALCELFRQRQDWSPDELGPQPRDRL